MLAPALHPPLAWTKCYDLESFTVSTPGCHLGQVVLKSPQVVLLCLSAPGPQGPSLCLSYAAPARGLMEGVGGLRLQEKE